MKIEMLFFFFVVLRPDGVDAVLAHATSLRHITLNTIGDGVVPSIKHLVAAYFRCGTFDILSAILAGASKLRSTMSYPTTQMVNSAITTIHHDIVVTSRRRRTLSDLGFSCQVEYYVTYVVHSRFIHQEKLCFRSRGGVCGGFGGSPNTIAVEPPWSVPCSSGVTCCGYMTSAKDTQVFLALNE
jgi:hypothetical protein